MPKANQHWKVLPHDSITEIDDGLLTVVGHITMPLMDLPRRMTVIRLSGGRLVVWSAIALGEEEMAWLESYGAPASAAGSCAACALPAKSRRFRSR